MENKQKQTLIVAVAVLVVALIGGASVYMRKEAQIKALASEKTMLASQLQTRNSLMVELEDTFTEIENSLTFVREKRNALTIDNTEGVKDQKKELAANVKLMDEMLFESAKKIEELEAKLKKSGVNSRAFEKRIAVLNKNIEDQNSQIAELKQMIEQKDFQLAEFQTKVDEMNVAMTVQNDSLARESQRLVSRTNQINVGHVAYGTFKELKEKGVLVREGGLLGIGSSKQVNQNFDPEYFTQVDIRDTKIVPLHSKKAQVVTEHPSDSYQLIEENGEIAYLQIDKPDEFWKISKYAVIEVK